ncbi:MAG: hypothetical protein V4550_18385 [Gemmatimonadota bacterium]
MKHIIVPADVNIVDRGGKEVKVSLEKDGPAVPWVITHEDFVYDNLCVHPNLSKGGGNGARRQQKIEQVFLGCKPGDVIGVEDADFVVAIAVIGTFEWSPSFARYATQMLPHIEAWEAAEKQNDAWKKARDEKAKEQK